MNVNNGVFYSQTFKYNTTVVGKASNVVNNTNSSIKKTKKVVPLNYLSNFWRLLKILLINCEVWIKLD